jgi:regulator of nucleoside diphosphate kinase
MTTQYAMLEPAGQSPEVRENELMKGRKKRTKDNLLISSFDKKRLMRLLRSGESAAEQREDLEDLAHEIERGTEVQPQEIPADVVTMNSTVRVTDVDAGSTHVYTIVFPADADYEKGKISILAPLGTALLGFRVGDTVDWHMPRGNRRLRIDEILYQPEAAGDFHL